MGPHPKPLHKNIIFLGLIGLIGVFMTVSMVLYSKLDDIADDDLIVGSGGGDGLRDRRKKKKRHHRHSHHRKAKPEEKKDLDSGLKEIYLDDEPQTAITRFQKDQEDAQKQRRRLGIVTVREQLEQEKMDPDEWERINESVQALRQPEIPTQTSDLAYDIHNCPLEPPPNYPFAWKVLSVLQNWNPDDTEELPQSIHQGICVFDWNREGDDQKAERYRQQELPFILANYPETLRATERWSTPGYLEDLLGEERNVNEHSLDNHFMYWKTKAPRPDYQPPTDTIQMTFKEWRQKAKQVQETPQQQQTQVEHWYYRLNAMLHNHAYLYEELPFFDPTAGKSLTMVDPEEHRGINCRFGMKGTVAESHYDSHNNFIALMGGQRRYILAHPNQCENMELYPAGHPSARHSRIDWSKAYFLWRDSERPFVNTMVNEVVLQPGDMLYLPTYWFHFIVSLNTTYQCNSRSGESHIYQPHIDRCGFGKKNKQRN